MMLLGVISYVSHGGNDYDVVRFDVICKSWR